MRGLKWTALVVILGACVPEADAPVDAAADPCTAAGGRMGTSLSGPICIRPAADAGSGCISNNDCESGICLAGAPGDIAGTCAPETPYLGCHDVMSGPGQRAALCVD